MNTDRHTISLFSDLLACPPNSDTIYETAAKLLFSCVSWSKSLPSFSQLPPSDQTALLASAWSQLFVLAMAQWKVAFDEGEGRNSMELATSNFCINTFLVLEAQSWISISLTLFIACATLCVHYFLVYVDKIKWYWYVISYWTYLWLLLHRYDLWLMRERVRSIRKMIHLFSVPCPRLPSPRGRPFLSPDPRQADQGSSGQDGWHGHGSHRDDMCQGNRPV